MKAGCSDEFGCDHSLIFGIHSGRVRKEQPLVKLVRSMKNCCTQDIVSDLLGAPWNVIETFDCIDDIPLSTLAEILSGPDAFLWSRFVRSS